MNFYYRYLNVTRHHLNGLVSRLFYGSFPIHLQYIFVHGDCILHRHIMKNLSMKWNWNILNYLWLLLLFYYLSVNSLNQIYFSIYISFGVTSSFLPRKYCWLTDSNALTAFCVLLSKLHYTLIKLLSCISRFQWYLHYRRQKHLF